MSIIELTDEQRMIRDVARDFAESEIKPIAGKLDKEGKFPVELVKKLGSLDLWVFLSPKNMGEAA